jgi:hypothetical protein
MSEDACEVNPGRWYLCAVCLTCQEAIPLVEVVRTAPRGSEASFVFKAVPCPRCETRHDYPVRDAIRLRAAGQPRKHAILRQRP